MKITAAIFSLIFFCASTSLAWFDETHVAIAKAAGYEKYYLECYRTGDNRRGR